MKPIATVILLSYQREPNMSSIISSYRAQSVPVEIWTIDNAPETEYCEWHHLVDRLVTIPWNGGEWARYPFVGRVETDWCLFQDDDWLIQDERFVEDAIDEYCTMKPLLLGTAGRLTFPRRPYYRDDVKRGWANVLKGHFQCFRPSVVRRARIPNHPSASDILWSMDIANGKKRHWVSSALRERLHLIDQHGVGLEYRPHHYLERDSVVQSWYKERKNGTS